jgi:hypothetical protein
MERPPHQKTARDVLRAVCGGILNPRFPRLTTEQQDAVLAPHAELIAKGEQALDLLLGEAQERGVATTHRHLRSADAFEAEAVDQVMESRLQPDDDADPLEVPRRPWPGGL